MWNVARAKNHPFYITTRKIDPPTISKVIRFQSDGEVRMNVNGETNLEHGQAHSYLFWQL